MTVATLYLSNDVIVTLSIDLMHKEIRQNHLLTMPILQKRGVRPENSWNFSIDMVLFGEF